MRLLTLRQALTCVYSSYQQTARDMTFDSMQTVDPRGFENFEPLRIRICNSMRLIEPGEAVLI